MPSHRPLVRLLSHLFLLSVLCCLVGRLVVADSPSNPYRNCDPALTPCAKPEEGTPACSACALAPQSAACLTAYNRQPAIYCGNSTMQLSRLLISVAACCPLVLDSTPVQCVPIQYNISTGGVFLIDSFTCRGKVLPTLPDDDRRLQTALALVGVMAPICLILAVYAMCRLYRKCRSSHGLPKGESFLDDTDTTSDGLDYSATDDSTAGSSYEVPMFRPPSTFQSEGEMVALSTSPLSGDSSRAAY